MKTRNTFLTFLLVCAAGWSYAQTIEISPTYGYQFGTKQKYGANYIKLDDSQMLGISVGFELRPNYMVELSYLNMPTELLIRDRIASPQESRLSDLNAHWIMLGGMRYFGNEQIKPFVGGQLGVSIFSPDNVNGNIAPNGLEQVTKFSFGLKGGVLVMLSQQIGIKLQGNLLFPMQWGGFYVGAGSGGISTGVNTATTVVMGGFSGGLVFRLGTS
jgi:hypothetical protein